METDQIVGAPPPPAPRERRDWAAPFPFLVIMSFGVLLITYWPAITTGVVELVHPYGR